MTAQVLNRPQNRGNSNDLTADLRQTAFGRILPLLERKHLTLRTRIKRLARKTICFSESTEMHDTVIGLFINRYEFGLNV